MSTPTRTASTGNRLTAAEHALEGSPVATVPDTRAGVVGAVLLAIVIVVMALVSPTPSIAATTGTLSPGSQAHTPH